MKFNWGTGIALAYGIFVFGMLGAVYASRQSDPGLVSQDYYSLDIHYQDRLDKKQHAAELAGGLPVRFDVVRQSIILNFPAQLGAPEGSVKLFRSSTVNDDQNLKIEADKDGNMVIPTEKMAAGAWHIEVDWSAGGRGYFNEQTLTITHA